MLSLTITPAKTWEDGERVTYAGLTQTGSPTGALAGSASSDQIGAKTVTAAKTKLDASGWGDDLRDAGKTPIDDAVVKAGLWYDVRAWDGVDPTGVEDSTAGIQAALTALIAAGGGTLDFANGSYKLAQGWTAGSAAGCLKGTAASAVKLSLVGMAGGGARLFTAGEAGAGGDFQLLNLSGSFEDLRLENLCFEHTSTAPVTELTTGVEFSNATANENGTLKRVAVRGCHFRNWVRGIGGGAGSLRVTGCEWSYPYGRPASSALPCVGIWMLVESGSGEVARDVVVEGNIWVGCETATAGSGYLGPADGLVYGRAINWVVANNIVRRAAAEGIFIEARNTAQCGTRAWATEPGSVVVSGNRIDCDRVSGQVVAVTAVGIQVGEPNATIVGNTIRGCRRGISLANNFSDGTEATRPKNFAVTGNVIHLMTSLSMMVDGLTVEQRTLVGIHAYVWGSGTISGNTIVLPNAATGLTTEKQTMYGVQLGAVSDCLVNGNAILGAGTALEADKVWRIGVGLAGTERCQVEGNRFYKLHAGVNACTTALGAYSSSDNEFGRNWSTGVLWCGIDLVMSAEPTTLAKSCRGSGYVWRQAATKVAVTNALLGGATGWLRLGSCNATMLRGRLTLRTSGAFRGSLVAQVDYQNQGYLGGVTVVAASWLGSGNPFTKVRCCTNADGLAMHLDVEMPDLSGQEVEVEWEGAETEFALWPEPKTPANSVGTFTGALAGSIVEVIVANGCVSMPGKHTSPLIIRDGYFWRDATGDLRVSSTLPGTDLDGAVVGTQS